VGVALCVSTPGSLEHSAHDARLEEETPGKLNPRSVIDNRKLFGVMEGSRAVEVRSIFC
jgi:hypothetical protein